MNDEVPCTCGDYDPELRKEGRWEIVVCLNCGHVAEAWDVPQLQIEDMRANEN